MNRRLLVALFAVALPFAAASYGGPSQGYSGAGGIDELVQAAAGGHERGHGSVTANADIQPSPAEAARLRQIQAQLQALNANPTYSNLKNSENIAESLAESNLASNIRQGNVNVVAPNVVDQGVYRSLLVPSGRNNHQVIATRPLPPIVVNQPGGPPAHVSSGPAAVVKAAPVIYKIKPSVIYQQEVINKVPTPLSLNPVYVKVYKSGKKIDAPLSPVVQPVYQPSYSAPSYGAPSQSYGAPSQSYGAPSQSYEAPSSSYGSGPTSSGAGESYGSAPSYSQQGGY